MLNQVVLVGKVIEMPQLRETTGGNKVASLLLEVDRSFKTMEGVVEKDIFNVQLWRGIAEDCCNLCVIGSLLGVKGRIQSFNYQKEENTYYNAQVVAEKVSFLNVNLPENKKKED